jgi:hypothetical protein
MKKIFVFALFAIALVSYSCNDNSTKEPGTHTHDDGTTHTDHDTTKPNQQEFKVGDSTHTDSTHKEHSHGDSTKHTH